MLSSCWEIEAGVEVYLMFREPGDAAQMISSDAAQPWDYGDGGPGRAALGLGTGTPPEVGKRNTRGGGCGKRRRGREEEPDLPFQVQAL